MTKSVKSNGYHTKSTKVWQALSLILPSRNVDYDYWWQMTGADLAYMVDAAGYSIEKQYEALLFHYHWITPYMGPALEPESSFEWPCVLTLEGLPVEYSWKWNVAAGKPEVRYCIEAKNCFSGTAVDPLNQDPSREMLHKLSKAFPGIDLSWTNHFLAALYDHDRSKYEKESVAGVIHTTTIMIAIEFKPSGLRLKTYFIPRKLGLDQMPLSLWKESILSVCPTSRAASALFTFMSSPQGQFLSPTMLAVDNVQPDKSRLKFYLQSPRTDFASTRQIMTLGGRIDIPETKLQDLRSLISAVAGLGPDFPETEELPVALQYNPPVEEASNDKTLVLPGYGFYFDINPQNDLPEIKIFIRLCVVGPDDLGIGNGLTSWMEKQGRGEHCDRYMEMVEKIGRYRRLDEGKGIHTHVSCLFLKNGDLEITSYLAPETSRKSVMSRSKS